METWTLVLLGLLMAVGLLGVIVPIIPGSLLIAAAAIAWAWLADGTAPWVVAGVMVVVVVLGMIATYVVPGKALKGTGAPRSTMLLGAACAIVGFFVIPIVGLPVGGLIGVWLGELNRLKDPGEAWRSTWATAKAFGLGVVIELAAGVLAVLTWIVAVVALV